MIIEGRGIWSCWTIFKLSVRSARACCKMQAMAILGVSRLAWCATRGSHETTGSLQGRVPAQRAHKSQVGMSTASVSQPGPRSPVGTTSTSKRLPVDAMSLGTLAGRTHEGAVSILPFDDLRGNSGMTVGEYVEKNPKASVVIEGFPGFTLRGHGLPDSGYKKARNRPLGDKGKRARIVNFLRDECKLPISKIDADEAIKDVEGDALDALVLLDAAKSASGRSLEHWRREIGSRAGIEGWFFD